MMARSSQPRVMCFAFTPAASYTTRFRLRASSVDIARFALARMSGVSFLLCRRVLTGFGVPALALPYLAEGQ